MAPKPQDPEMTGESEKLNGAQAGKLLDNNSSVDDGGDDITWDDNQQVEYGIDETPPVYLCLLLGFQVSVFDLFIYMF